MSTKNETELPKCSKSLHFRTTGPKTARRCLGEYIAKKVPNTTALLLVFCLRTPVGRVFGRSFYGIRLRFGHLCARMKGLRAFGGVCMEAATRETERRKWTRLPLAIPVFVRSRDRKGKEFLEFATALNVSAGGMLVAIRRVLPAIAQLRLEIPSAPIASLAPRAARTLRAKILRTTPADGYYLLGLKFSHPLPLSAKPAARGRKLVSAV